MQQPTKSDLQGFGLCNDLIAKFIAILINVNFISEDDVVVPSLSLDKIDELLAPYREDLADVPASVMIKVTLDIIEPSMASADAFLVRLLNPTTEIDNQINLAIGVLINKTDDGLMTEHGVEQVSHPKALLMFKLSHIMSTYTHDDLPKLKEILNSLKHNKPQPNLQ
jgi:hypothetical protein